MTPPVERPPKPQDDWLTVLHGDCRDILPTLEAESVHCVVTSPPYWGLRDYGVDGQLGLEKTPEEYVAAMVGVFREVKRVLRSDGTLWLNLGDSYAHSGRGEGGAGIHSTKQTTSRGSYFDGHSLDRRSVTESGLKPKDLVGIPWMVAFALRSDGWYLRSDIIWSKPNPMPESVTDRPTKSHEYLFLLTKSPRYWYDAEAVAESAQEWSGRAAEFGREGNAVADHIIPGQTAAQHRPRRSDKQAEMAAAGSASTQRRMAGFNDRWDAAERKRATTWAERKANGAHPGSHGVGSLVDSGTQRNVHGEGMSHDLGSGLTRNRRSVWTIATQPYPGAHFATFPPKLVEPCILAGCPENGLVLDPFAGTGTVGMVAQKLSRRAVLIDLNGDYLNQLRERNAQVPAGLVA